MTNLTVRSPQFRIDASVPFQWQPSNPSFGLFGNTFTFLAIAFERYIVAATRQALPRFTDTDVTEEADLFVRQEAQQRSPPRPRQGDDRALSRSPRDLHGSQHRL